MNKYIPPEELAEIKKIDLLTYLANYEPNELIKYGRNDYGTKTHSSLHISNGLWTWWAKNIGGKSALDYLIKVEGFDFIEAASLIKKCINSNPPVIQKNFKKHFNYETLMLPKKAKSNQNAIAYLTKKRCIDREIVDYYIDKNMIYESGVERAVVFVGHDNKNIPRFASKRYIDTTTKKNIYGSNKQWSFRLENSTSEILHIFESPIDLMSFQTFEKTKNKKWNNGNYLSLDGASLIGKDINDAEIPIALERFLKNNPNIKSLFLHLDNDRAGHDTAYKIIYYLSERYQIVNEVSSRFKDINEWLIRVLKTKNLVKTR